jgi:hypothetical protein|tara:strand:- start:444 stop:683 length:240 start_codon:yes stop_codon:yes gene_type:complete
MVNSNQALIDLIIEKFDGSIVEDNKWRVDGSKGNHYWVEWHPFHKHYSCGCKGYAFRKKCRHITEVSNQFKNNLFQKNA